ncbi:hypothetical protein [Thalassobaculum sp.]|jgi:hypothetical protein|uniref:hypothetical protein n=1 Tax=Thalassobaculum sp. TaxID=2022740 RepID=UPI0032EF54B3
MSAVVVNLFDARPTVDFTLNSIGIDEWSERLIRVSSHLASLRRCDVFTFLVLSPSICENAIILEFDQNGRNPDIISASTQDTGGRFERVLRHTVVPGMVFDDSPRGWLLSSSIQKYPVQFLYFPLPSGDQKFGAIIY